MRLARPNDGLIFWLFNHSALPPPAPFRRFNIFITHVSVKKKKITSTSLVMLIFKAMAFSSHGHNIFNNQYRMATVIYYREGVERDGRSGPGHAGSLPRGQEAPGV